MRFKTIVFLLINLAFCFEGNSQLQKYDNYILGVNAGMAKPLGDFSQISKLGTDFRLSAKWLMNEKIAVGIESGYVLFGQDDKFWNGANLGENDVNYQLIPVMLTGTYYLKAWDRDFRPYVSIGFGYFFYKNKVKFTSFSTEKYPYNGNPSLKYKIKDNKVGLVPSVGFLYNVNKDWAIDFSARYTYIPNFSEIISVSQEFTNAIENIDNKYVVNNYPMGFTKLSSISLSIGLFYRF